MFDQKEYWQNHKEKFREANRKSYLKHREKRVQKNREYRLNDPEKCRAQARKSYQKHKDKLNKSRREKYSNNHMNFQEKRKKRVMGYRIQWIHILKKHYGEIRCQRCGYNENFSAIVFHHRNPEKKKHKICDFFNRKPTLERIGLLKKEVEKCDLLCANCHEHFHHPEHLLESLIIPIPQTPGQTPRYNAHSHPIF